MRKNQAILPFIMILIWALSMLTNGCRLKDQGDKEGISSDVITNPQSASGEVDTSKLPRIAFEKEVFELGRIPEGERKDLTIRFTNKGESALVISHVEGSCGCTVADDWPKEPIEPGGTETIGVTYDSEGHKGKQHKTVSIVANTNPSTNMISIKADVVVPDNIQNGT